MKYISVKRVIPGMVLAKPILNENGKALLKKGVKLDEYHIDFLTKNKIESICIFEKRDNFKRELTPVEKQELKHKTKKIYEDKFKFCLHDKMMRALFDAIINNDIENN